MKATADLEPHRYDPDPDSGLCLMDRCYYDADNAIHTNKPDDDATPAAPAGHGQDDDDEPSSWQPIDLSSYIDGDGPTVAQPTIGRTVGGPPMFYRRRVNALYAPSECGKTHLVKLVMAQVLSDGGVAVYVDQDDNGPDAVVRDLLRLGVTPDALRDRFRYIAPDESVVWSDLFAAADGADIVVFDTTNELLSLQRVNPNDNEGVTAVMREIPRRVARLGPAVVLLDHVPKDPDAPRDGPTSAASKKNAINGVMYRLDLVRQFVPGRGGSARVTIHKDRPGAVRAETADGRSLGVFVMESDGDRIVAEVRVGQPPEPATFRPTVLMARVSDFLAADGGEVTLRTICEAVKGKRQGIVDAVRVLVDEGYVAVVPDGRARRHRLVRPFRGDDRSPHPDAGSCDDADRSPRSPDVSPRSPGNGDDRSPVPPPPTGGNAERHRAATVTVTADDPDAPFADSAAAIIEAFGATDVTDPAEYIRSRRADGADRFAITRELNAMGYAAPGGFASWNATAVARIEGTP